MRGLFICFLLLLSQTIAALPEDREKPAQLKANTADLNQQSHRGEYSGKVKFDQGTTHLRATKAITQGDKQNKLISAFAFGDKNKQAHYWEKTSVDKPILHAYADEIRYYAARHLIELKGNARVIQGEDSCTAVNISYDTVKQHVIAKSTGKNRTVIIIHPGKKNE